MPRKKVVCSECGELFSPTSEYPSPFCKYCTQEGVALREDQWFERALKLLKKWPEIPDEEALRLSK